VADFLCADAWDVLGRFGSGVPRKGLRSKRAGFFYRVC